MLEWLEVWRQVGGLVDDEKGSDIDSDKHSDTDSDNDNDGLIGSWMASLCLLTNTLTETLMMTLTKTMKMADCLEVVW